MRSRWKARWCVFAARSSHSSLQPSNVVVSQGSECGSRDSRELLEELLATLPDGGGEIAVVVGEECEGTGGAPFLSLEEHGDLGPSSISVVTARIMAGSPMRARRSPRRLLAHWSWFLDEGDEAFVRVSFGRAAARLLSPSPSVGPDRGSRAAASRRVRRCALEIRVVASRWPVTTMRAARWNPRSTWRRAQSRLQCRRGARVRVSCGVFSRREEAPATRRRAGRLGRLGDDVGRGGVVDLLRRPKRRPSMWNSRIQ